MSFKIKPVVVACRPKQWVKNLVVFALPLSDGLLIGKRMNFGSYLDAFIFFCCMSMISSSNYLLNDIFDRELDRKHPTKNARPIASGQLKVKTGVVIAVALFILPVIAVLLFFGAFCALALLVFGTTQFLYSIYFKNRSGYDVVSLSCLYVIRAVIPATYEDVIISQWYFMMFFSAALFLATSKRYSESKNVGHADTRKVLSQYSEFQLLTWVGVSISVLIFSYLSWIFTFYGISSFSVIILSIIPMTIILFRVSGLSLGREGEDPTTLLLKDKSNLVMLGIWLILYLWGKGYL